MFGDYFLENCLISCCSLKDSNYNTKDILSSIYFIIKWYKKENDIKKQEVTSEFQEKIDIVYFISQYRCTSTGEFDFDYFIEKMRNGKFKHIIPILISKRIDLNDEEIIDIKDKILSQRKICELLKGKKDIQTFLNDFDSGNFSDDEEIIKRWELQLNNMYTNLVKVNTQQCIDSASKLNLLEDDYEPVIKKLRESLDEKETMKTGFNCIDMSLPARGFESRRLYVIGGTSGVGKSAFLINLIRNAVKNNKSDKDVPKYYLYITAENLIDESLLRFYCCVTGEPVERTIVRLKEDEEFNLKEKLINFQVENNSVILFYYVESRKTRVQDIDNLVSRVYDESKHKLKGVFLDYLDLISANDTSLQVDNIRLAQGQISQELKNIAVRYFTSMITCTQLNRSGYDKKVDPTLIQMGESMKKVDDADFVLFIQEVQDSLYRVPTSYGTKEYEKVRMTILKNRNGSVGQTVQLSRALKLSNESIFNFRFEELPTSNDKEILMDVNTVLDIDL